MAIRSLNPYITLEGNAREAIPFYVAALGAETTGLMTYGQLDPQTPTEHQDRVAHCALSVEGLPLMVSDMPPGVTAGRGKVNIALGFDDADQARRSFQALAESGTISAPLDTAPWGGLFGMLTDRYGIDWLITCQVAASAA